MAYQAKSPPTSPQDIKGVVGWAQSLVSWLVDELRAVTNEFNSTRSSVVLKVLYAAPERIYPGMVVIADGVTWNPGSGVGMYYRNAANTAWVFVG